MKKILGALLLVLCFAFAANATTISVVKNQEVYDFGETNTATYGQTFNLAAEQDNVLDSVTFQIKHTSSPDAIDFAFYLYDWNGSNITGSSLFESSMMSTSSTNIWETFTVNLGGVVLSNEKDYVWLVSASNFFDCLEGIGRIASNVGGGYNRGHFIFMNNGNDFSKLFTGTFTQTWCSSDDLAFTMELSTPSSEPAPIPEPRTILLLLFGIVGMVGIKKYVIL